MPKAEEAPRTEAERSLRHSRLWTLASFGLALLVSAGLYVPLVRNERDEVREHWRDHLMALADDRDQSIQDYLAERSGDARTLADLPRVAEHLEAVRSGLPPDRVDASRIRLETHLSHLRANFGYVAVYCLDAEGRTVASSPGAPTLDPVCVSEVRRTLEGGADRFVDLHRRESGRLTFSHHALVGNPAGGSALGLVVLESDPDRRLFPLLLRQPTPTRTAETLIGAVWHGKLAFLSPLRFGSPTPPSYPVATPEKTLALKAALEGQETFGEFSDYRGEEVLAATRRIDGTPWGLVAKVDRAEAFERLGGWMVRYILFAVLAALSLALLVYGILRRQRLRLLEDLSRQEGLYRALSEQTHDIFILARPDGTIVEANAAAERAYGYGRSELLRMNIVDLRAPSARASLPAARAAALRPEGSLHETLHLSRTGVEFPVEIQAQPVTLGRERLLAGIIRDISERKAQQQRILKLNRLYRTLSEANQALVRAASREDLLKQTCRVLVDYGGFGRACVALQPPVEAGSAVAVAGYPEEPLSGCADQALPDPLPSTPLVLTEGGTHRAFLPLRQYGTLCGVLCVASKEAG
ncbi:MAG: PAS domain S-box protein, partial [Acidobacteriota bacterium]